MKNEITDIHAEDRAYWLNEEKSWDEEAKRMRDIGLDDSDCIDQAQFCRRQLWLLDSKG